MSTIPKIKNLKQLLKIIDTGPGYDGTGQMLLQIDFGPEEVIDLCRWSDQGYQKIPIEKNAQYALYLMCWEAGQASPIHDHASAQGWICVLEGELKESLFYREDAPMELELKFQETITPGKVSYINDSLGIHKIQNIHPNRTVSLHYYIDPKDEVLVYDELTGESTAYKLH